MHHHTKFGYKRLSGSEDIFWTKPEHTKRQTGQMDRAIPVYMLTLLQWHKTPSLTLSWGYKKTVKDKYQATCNTSKLSSDPLPLTDLDPQQL